MMKLSFVFTVLALSGRADACNRIYTTTKGGRRLSRINRRNGVTKNIGKWVKRDLQSDRMVRSLEWNIPQQKMVGIEEVETTSKDQNGRTQRFMKVNRRELRGKSINNVTKGDTGSRSLRGMAADANSTFWAHDEDGEALYTVNPDTGKLTLAFETGLSGIIDLAYNIDTDRIWACLF